MIYTVTELTCNIYIETNRILSTCPFIIITPRQPRFHGYCQDAHIFLSIDAICSQVNRLPKNLAICFVLGTVNNPLRSLSTDSFLLSILSKRIPLLGAINLFAAGNVSLCTFRQSVLHIFRQLSTQIKLYRAIQKDFKHLFLPKYKR